MNLTHDPSAGGPGPARPGPGRKMEPDLSGKTQDSVSPARACGQADSEGARTCPGRLRVSLASESNPMIMIRVPNSGLKMISVTIE